MSTTDIHRIKAAGIKFETTDKKRAQERLKEIRKTQPSARLLTIPASR